MGFKFNKQILAFRAVFKKIISNTFYNNKQANEKSICNLNITEDISEQDPDSDTG